MTAGTGGIGGLPPAPPFDCDGDPPVPPAFPLAVTLAGAQQWDIVNAEAYFTDPCTAINVNGGNIQPAVLVQLVGDESAVAGIRLHLTGGSTIDITSVGDYVYQYVAASAWVFYRPSILGDEIASVEILDASNTPISEEFILPTPVPLANISGVVTSNDLVHVNFDGMATGAKIDWDGAGVDSFVNIQTCGPNPGEVQQIQLWNPNGPNAGSNPGGITINQWDDDGIDVTGLTFLYSPVAIYGGINGGSAYFAVNSPGVPTSQDAFFTSISQTGPLTVQIVGGKLLTNATGTPPKRVQIDLDGDGGTNFFAADSVNVGLNPPGTTFTVIDDNTLEITSSVLAPGVVIANLLLGRDEPFNWPMQAEINPVNPPVVLT